MIYTGIGSRNTPSEICAVMFDIAYQLARTGWTLRSGGAQGADEAFESGVLSYAKAYKVDRPMEIYIPWHGFNGASIHNHGYGVVTDEITVAKAYNIASTIHPNWNACSRGAKQLHMRNIFQILGENLDNQTKLVICWTKDGKRQGGTGQALRLAESLNIPIIDLALAGALDRVQQLTHEIEEQERSGHPS